MRIPTNLPPQHCGQLPPPEEILPMPPHDLIRDWGGIDNWGPFPIPTPPLVTDRELAEGK